jgi:hypothetical protein
MHFNIETTCPCCGHKQIVTLKRDLPKGAYNFINIKKEDLSQKTKDNLSILEMRYNITWTKYFRYNISRNRYGYIIQGIVKNRFVEYWRIETKSPVAGQTYLYFSGFRFHVKMTKIRDNINGFDLQAWKDFCILKEY